jgi:hypothetical protein
VSRLVHGPAPRLVATMPFPRARSAPPATGPGNDRVCFIERVTVNALGTPGVDCGGGAPAHGVGASRGYLKVGRVDAEPVRAIRPGAACRRVVAHVVDRLMRRDRAGEALERPAVRAPVLAPRPELAVPVRCRRPRPAPALIWAAPVHVGPEAGVVVSHDHGDSVRVSMPQEPGVMLTAKSLTADAVGASFYRADGDGAFSDRVISRISGYPPALVMRLAQAAGLSRPVADLHRARTFSHVGPPYQVRPLPGRSSHRRRGFRTFILSVSLHLRVPVVP